MDDIDKRILNILQESGRITNSELAGRIGLSPPSVIERIKKIENAGIIIKYSAIVNPKKVNKRTMTLVAITLSPHEEKEFKTFNILIESWPEVLECFHVTGEEDYILKVVVKDIESYEKFLFEKVMQIPGIKKIHTSMVLSTIKENGSILVE